MNDLTGKTILIRGAARCVGKIFALACARAVADVVIHHGNSEEQAESVRAEIVGMGRNHNERNHPSRWCQAKPQVIAYTQTAKEIKTWTKLLSGICLPAASLA